jgi:ribosomal protein S18 acetylase RimI-like enzyme
MSLAVALRDARPEDAPELARIRLLARATAMPGVREAHDEAGVAQWIATWLMANHRVRVAEADDRIVGYMGRGDDPDLGPVVFHLYLHPSGQRQGVGTRLLGEAMAAHPDRLSLWCIARNAGARAFYERHGFRADRFGDGSNNEEGEPDVLYVRAGAAQHTTGEVR